ncbi:MAG: hypothetical protein WCR30_02380 [Clostridia bacterium]
MDKESFSTLLTDLVLPMFAGASIIGENDSSPRDFEVAQGVGGTVLVKPEKKDEYRLIIKRNQPFKSTDTNILKEIIIELVKVSYFQVFEPTYLKKLQNIAIEKAICRSLFEESASTMVGLIEDMLVWSQKTYEGHGLTFGFIINGNAVSKSTDKNLMYSEILKNDFSALLSDGIMSYLELDKDGYLIDHNMLTSSRSMSVCAPYLYSGFARASHDKRIGISLAKSGDLLIFKDCQLTVSRRHGVWNIFSHNEIVGLLSNNKSHTIKDIRKSIYFSALDTAFTRAGGCIVILDAGQIGSVLKHIDVYDIIDEKSFELKKQQEFEESEKLFNYSHKQEMVKEIDCSFENFLKNPKCVKSSSLRKIIGNRKFHELDRKLRQELIGMDGAMVVDYDGTIVAVGAIIKIEAGSTGGGRLAATRTLSRYGVAMKISTDGFIQGFAFDKKANLPKNIFSVG